MTFLALSLLLSLIVSLAHSSASTAKTSTASRTGATTTTAKTTQRADESCSRLYWSKTPLIQNKNTPPSLHGASLGHSAGGNIIAVNVGASGVPSAYYLNPLTNTWTSQQSADAALYMEGATLGQSTVTASSEDAEPSDVFVIFGGQTKEGQYSKQVVRYKGDSGFAALVNTATSSTASPIGRAGGTMTGIQSDSNGNAQYLLIGGVDDDKDFADAWVLTLHGEPDQKNTFTWTEVAPQENTFGFDGRTGHASTRWTSATATTSNVIVFGGCQQSGTTAKCFNDVWMASVVSKEGSAPTMQMSKLNVAPASNSNSLPTAAADATIVVYEDVLYVYGGCAVTAGNQKCAAQMRSIPLSSLMAKDSTELVSWSSPTTGNAVVGQAIGGAGFIHVSTTIASSFVVLGGCANGEVTCTVQRQDVNLKGECAGACQNGAKITTEGVCECTEDYSGVHCEEQISAAKVDCPKNCDGHGTCVSGKCQCEATYGGVDCATRVCSVEGPEDCSGHGTCKTVPDSNVPLCVCSGNYYGVICSETKCAPENCNDAGTCNTKLGKCDCNPGFGGMGCSKQDLCPGNCTNHGTCTTTKASAMDDSTSACACDDGFIGAGCERDDRCMAQFGGCGEHGKCQDLACTCEGGYTGKKCEQKECPNDGCGGHGSCDAATGLCTCDFGFVGEGCAKTIICLNNCTGPANGLCVSAGGADPTLGECKCSKKFRGEDCSQVICPLAFPHQFADTKLECAGTDRGTCDGNTGTCVCDPAYGGFACEFACPSGTKFRANEIHPSKDHMNMGRQMGIDAKADVGDAALGACSGHGVCVTTLGGDAKCLCERGIEGEACDQEMPCPVANCSGNGVCFRGKCLCVAGFEGDDCAKQLTCNMDGNDAEIECSGHGTCNLGKCYCDAGWESNKGQCNQKLTCKNSCNGHGKCHNAECFCATGWSGDECQKHATCKNKCSGHGVCFLDECVCEVGYSADDCSAVDETLIKTKCDGGCNDRGTCQFGKCFCNPGFGGANCQNRVDYECPKAQGVTCAGNGECLYNKCFCMPGFDGKACEKEAKCPNDCSGNGACANGMCYCKPPYRGADCNSTLACKDDCNSRGICLDGKCACVEGFKGDTCSFGADVCPNECSGHGACQIGRCFCDPSWSGKGCSEHTPKRCPNDCSSSGLCHNGKCICEPGMIGDDCGTPMPCPPGCRKNGLCERGLCWCRPGYSGLNCSTPNDAELNAQFEKNMAREKQLDVGFRECPNQCSHNGVCFDGECMCEAGYSGVDCAVVEVGNDSCQNDCGAFGGTKTARGRCWLGKCFCYPGFQGSDCTEVLKLPCPTDDDLGVCSGSGECHYGRCFCDIGFAGKACSTPVGCPGDCAGHGTCHRGRCKCETGFMGSNCNSTELICENNCHGNGACILGACACNPGWSGRACAVKAAVEMDSKTELAHLTDAQSTESAVTNPDAENVVQVHQPSVDYTIASGKTSTQNKVEHPNRMTLSSSILPKETVEESVPTTKSPPTSSPAQKSKPSTSKEMSSLLLIEESSSTTPHVRLECSPIDCSGRGECHRGTCYCNPGFAGDGCEQSLSCPGTPDCNGQGECFNGKCVCVPGYTGEGCEVETSCLHDCNKRGECRWGQCFCDVGFGGSACETQIDAKATCTNGCSGNGICEAGACFCKAQYSGEDCSTAVDLHTASTLWARAQKKKQHDDHSAQDDQVGGKRAFGVASLCFVGGVGMAMLVAKYR